MAKLILTISNDADVTLHTATVNLNDAVVDRILAMAKGTNPNPDATLPNDAVAFTRMTRDVKAYLKARTATYEQDQALQNIPAIPGD
jgi:hypothetical protein